MTITTDRTQNLGGQKLPRRTDRPLEPFLKVAAGLALAGAGVWRRDWVGAALAGGGSYLLYCGARDLRGPFQGSVRVAVTIAREREEIYSFLSNPENWPQFLASIRIARREGGHLELGIGRPPRLTIDSQFEVTDHKPGEYVAWASDQQGFAHRGVIHFKKAPGGRGTEVSIAMEYRAAAGPIARSLTSLMGQDPEQVARESLRHLKQLMEAGEIPTTAGQPVGARGATGAILRVLYRERPTQPAEAPTKIAGD